MEKMILTACEIAIALDIGKNAAYNLLHQEGFPSIRIGRKLVVPRDAFLKWISEQAEKAG